MKPALLYGAPLFTHLFKSTSQDLQRFQNGVMRKVVRHTSLQRQKNTELHKLLDLPTVDEFG
ncbi:hypothetical protein, partial [Klebsiella pneumoniae]|uniref:hypothetical protein n=1 Tax=Klebsiella pneumoniae TaxID=573 RepID=UPI0040555E70